MVSRHRLYGPDLEPIEYWHVAPRDTAERARQDFLHGNISAGEFEKRLELAFAREEQDTTVIDRPLFDMPKMEGGAQEESHMVRKAGGVMALGAAAFIALTLLAFVAFGVAGLIVYLLSA